MNNREFSSLATIIDIRFGAYLSCYIGFSDLIPYGVETVIYKMDRGGSCLILDKYV